VRWFVDEMNVIGTRPDAWWKDRHGAMVKLVSMLERWAATSGEEVTVVFEPTYGSATACTHRAGRTMGPL
jgi:hypothetical protein